MKANERFEEFCKKNDPAFPIVAWESLWGGMSIRDYFAAKVLAGVCAHPDTWGLPVSHIAQQAYELADAMLKERAK